MDRHHRMILVVCPGGGWTTLLGQSMHAHAGANGVSAAFLQLAQRLAAGVSIAAVTAILLGGTDAGGAVAERVGAYRTALLHGTLRCLALARLALVFAVADRPQPSRTPQPQTLEVAQS